MIIVIGQQTAVPALKLESYEFDDNYCEDVRTYDTVKSTAMNHLSLSSQSTACKMQKQPSSTIESTLCCLIVNTGLLTATHKLYEKPRSY